MTSRTSKTAAPLAGAAVVVPVQKVEPVVIHEQRPTFEEALAALRSIADMPNRQLRCCCQGMHDGYNHNCAVVIARRALGEP